MPQPTPYDRITNFQNDQALDPTDPYPAPSFDAEYNAIKITLDEILQNLELIQRDDGQLANDSVGRDQLRDEVLIGFGVPTHWVTNYDYIRGDTVFQDNAFWFCEVSHTSTTFPADLALGYWSLIADFNDAATVGAKLFVQTSPPVTAVHGQQWFESDSGALFVFYQDASGPPGQWVHTNSGAGSGASLPSALNFPTSPVVGQAYENYVWDGQKWMTVAPGNAVVASSPPSSPVSGDLWWDSDTGIMYVWYIDTTGGQWVGASSSGGSFSEAPVDNRLYGRRNAAWVPAAPMDALAYSGMQVNGSMEVSQELGGTGTSVNGGYICDSWALVYTSAPISVTGAVYAGSGLAGFSNTIGVTVAAAKPSLAAGDTVGIQNRIEGYRAARLAWGTASAQPITVSFWTAHHRTGVYSTGIRQGSGTRSYQTTYTQNVADTWEYKTVTIPGDTAGTWNVSNGQGLIVDFAMACGATTTVPAANVWTAGNYNAAPGQVNGVATTSDAFRITGVVVLPGTQAPTAAQSPLIMRPYDQELVTCQRYFQWLGYNIVWYATTSGHQMQFPVTFLPMRATPTMGAVDPDPYRTPQAVNSSASGWANLTPYSASQYSLSAGAGVVAGLGYRSSADARL